MVLLTSQHTLLNDELEKLRFLGVQQRLTVDVRGMRAQIYVIRFA